jgi:hypothetical protein
MTRRGGEVFLTSGGTLARQQVGQSRWRSQKEMYIVKFVFTKRTKMLELISIVYYVMRA